VDGDAGWVESDPSWTLSAPVPFSLVCFRYAPAGMSDVEADARNSEILAAVNARGKAYLSHTKLNDRYVLRLAIGNILTAREHVALAWSELQRAASVPG
jgi:aromatic-L-amino-acid/L-tryptophan decarboxylase